MSQLDECGCAPALAGANGAGQPSRLRLWARYVVRHWRGEFPLSCAALLNGLVLGAVMLWAASTLGSALEDYVEPGVFAVGLTAAWVAVALVTLWQVVGVCRAADRHARAGHGRVAPGGTVVALLLGVVVGIGVFLRAGLPHIVEASQFALGKDPIGDVDLRVTADGAALELRGPIVFGVGEQVRAALSEQPGISTLRLVSPGGRVVEARALRDLIADHGITTVAAGNCASACVVAFMAGRERLLAPGGSIGFHRYRSPGMDDAEIEASMSIDRRDLAARGVPASFLERAFATPHSGMWRPTLAELKAANIITGVITADGTQVLVRHERGTIEAQALKQPLYVALKSREPQVYEQVIEAMEQGAQGGLSPLEVDRRTRPLLHRVAAKYAPAASDEAIVQAAEVAAETLHALHRLSSELCYRFIRAGADADLTVLPLELRERDRASTAAIIETGADAARQPDGPSTRADLQWVFSELLHRFGDDARVLDHPGAPNVDRAALCGAVTALYEQALALPPPRNAQLLRFLLAGN